MSISQMTIAWRMSGLTPTQKLVLLSLADNANDSGECYPSVAQIAQRTGLSDRAVQKTIGSMQEMGILSRVVRPGTSTIYVLTLDERVVSTPEPRSSQGRTTFTPERSSPPNDVHPTPERGSPPPPNQVHPTPERGSPKPSLNRQENRQLTVTTGRHEKPKADRDALLAMLLPDWLPPDAWADWVDHRIAVKSPMTERAADLALRHLDRLRQAGNDPVQVIEQSVRSGKWTDLYPLRDQRQAPARAGNQQRNESEHERFLRLTNEEDGQTLDLGAAR